MILAALVLLRFSPDASFVSVRDNGTASAGDVAQVGARYLSTQSPAAPSDVRLFHVDYRSAGYDGSSRLLSGLVALPTKGAPKGLVIYFHSTTTERETVPSRFAASGGPIEAQLAVAAFCEDGYAVVAPDYLGLGDDNGVHPYAMSSINCVSGIDMAAPTIQLAAAQGCPLGTQRFITGYSEGGAVAMWAAERLGDAATASSPISGAYDLSGTEVKAILSSQSNVKWLAARFFLGAYLGLTFTQLNPSVKLDDLFVPSFASYIPTVFRRSKTDEQIIKDLTAKGLEVGAVRTIKRALQPSLIKALQSRDAANPLVARLIAEDCYDWRPTSPVQMICLAHDYLVPAENAEHALEAMRARGAGPDVVSVEKVKGRGYDHVTFLPRGLSLARDFFDSLRTTNATRGL